MQPEIATGVIPDLSTGTFGQKTFNLVVTNYRLIFAEVTSELLNQEREKTAANNQNQGMMSRWAAQMSSHTEFHKRYFSIIPQDILRESPNNYELRPHQIDSVKIHGTQYGSYDGKNPGNKMVIKSTFGKEKFRFQRMNTRQVKDILVPLLGNKVR